MPLTKLPDVQVRSSSLAPHSRARRYVRVCKTPPSSREWQARHVSGATRRRRVIRSGQCDHTPTGKVEPTKANKNGHTHSSHARTRARDDGRRTLARRPTLEASASATARFHVIGPAGLEAGCGAISHGKPRGRAVGRHDPLARRPVRRNPTRAHPMRRRLPSPSPRARCGAAVFVMAHGPMDDRRGDRYGSNPQRNCWLVSRRAVESGARKRRQRRQCSDWSSWVEHERPGRKGSRTLRTQSGFLVLRVSDIGYNWPTRFLHCDFLKTHTHMGASCSPWRVPAQTIRGLR